MKETFFHFVAASFLQMNYSLLEEIKKDHGDIEELSIRSVLSLSVCPSMGIESKIVKIRIFDAALMIISLCMGNWAVHAPAHPSAMIL